MNIRNLNKKKLKLLLESNDRNEICKDYGISTRTLSRIIKEKGLTKKGYGPKKISLEKIHEVRKLYSEGKHTQEELANIYGISQSFVSKIVNKISRKIYHDISLTSNSKIRVGYKHGH
jgi:DNA invertase Pin-like site-specific DNA recombinase